MEISTQSNKSDLRLILANAGHLNLISLEMTLGNRIHSDKVSVAGMYSVGNSHDQMTKCTKFVTFFSSASGRIFQNISIYTRWNLFK